MDIYKAILKRRTIRKFKQTRIPVEILEKLINAGRLAPSGANMQPLKFIIVNDEESVSKIFPHLKFAAYLGTEGTPKENERPTAYVIVCIDKNIKAITPQSDSGAAIENIILTAVGENIGSCWMKAINRDKIREILNIPDNLEIDSLISLGYPNEESVTEELTDSVKYWKDESCKMHVPKRKIEDVLFWNKFDKNRC